MEGVGRGGRKVYFGTLATRLTLAARLVWRAATRLMAGRYAAHGEPLRGTTSWPRRGLGAASGGHTYYIPQPPSKLCLPCLSKAEARKRA